MRFEPKPCCQKSTRKPNEAPERHHVDQDGLGSQDGRAERPGQQQEGEQRDRRQHEREVSVDRAVKSTFCAVLPPTSLAPPWVSTWIGKTTALGTPMRSSACRVIAG